jgi:hypothetical protein
MVPAHGGLRRPRAAVSDDRAMSQWRIWLVRGGVPPLQDQGKPSTRCHPPAAGYAALEAGSLPEMPIMPERPLRAAGAHDQANRGTGDHALQVGAARRGSLVRCGPAAKHHAAIMSNNVPALPSVEPDKPKRISKRIRAAIDALTSGEAASVTAAAKVAGLSREHLSRELEAHPQSGRRPGAWRGLAGYRRGRDRRSVSRASVP